MIAFLAIVEQHSKANNFLTRLDFSFEHPIEEIGRVLYAVLLKHLGLGYVLFPILDACKCFDLLTCSQYFNLNCLSDASQPTSTKVPKSIGEVIKVVHQTKWNLIKSRQEANKSYKEICIPLLEKCRFLLYEVKPAVSLEMEAFKKVNILYKEPRVRTLVRKVIKDLKCGRHTSEIQKPEDIVNATIQSQSQERYKSSEDLSRCSIKKTHSDGKLAESKNENDDVNNEIKNGTQRGSVDSRVSDTSRTQAAKPDQKLASNCTEIKTEQEDKWNLEKIDNVCKSETVSEDKQKKLESQLTLSKTIARLTEKQMKKVCNENLGIVTCLMEFILKSSCDIEVLRKIMYNQVS